MRTRIVCFGELLLRLGSAERELLLQSPIFKVCVGGAEANVAVSLAKLGHQAVMVGALAENALGAAALAEIRRHGVDVKGISYAQGRMGLYFLTQGAMQRPSQVLYDRAGSAFALAEPETYDWPQLLAGAQWLHLSGVTPALGARSAQAAINAARCARQLGIRVAFDGNFRPALWQASGGDAAGILRQIMAEADLLFADHRDMAVVLQTEFAGSTPEAKLEAAAAAAFKAFPNLQRFTSTIREQHSVDHHTLSAMLLTRAGSTQRAQGIDLANIVDRIGAGDAFAAGVLHGIITGMDDGETLRFGQAAACLKHSIPGDFNLSTAADVIDLMAAARFDVRR